MVENKWKPETDAELAARLVTKRDERIRGLSAILEEKEAEVERLRSRVAELEADVLQKHVIAGKMTDECVSLRAENAGLRAALDGVLEHCEICGAIATHATQWSDRDLVYFCDRPECVTKVNGWYDGDHEYDRVGMYTWSLGHEKARDALDGSPSDLVLVPQKLLGPFVRIAERLEACESSRKLPDSAPLSAPMEDIPEVGAYISLGVVRELARIARGSPSETPISSGRE